MLSRKSVTTLSLFLIAMLGIGAQAATTIHTVDLSASDVVYDPYTGRMFAAVAASDAVYPNCLVQIEPVSGAVEGAVFVGSDPSSLAISGDGKYIYVGLKGAGKVMRYNVSSQAVDQEIPLGSGYFGTLYAEDIAVQPGNPNVIAVSRYRKGVSPRHGGVAVYDNGVMLPQTTSDHTGANRIEFSDDAQIMYGYNNETTGFGVYRLLVNEYGVAITDTYSGLISGFGTDLEYDDDHLYATSGRVVDTTTMTLAGQLGSSGKVAPDSSVRRTFFVSGVTLTAYNQETFTRTGEVTLQGISNATWGLIRWGEDGLSFCTNNQVVIVQTDLVPPSPVVEELTIEGPDHLSSYKGHYRVTAAFDDGIVKDVTAKSQWSTSPDDHTRIDSIGQLYVFGTDQPGSTTVQVEYGFNGVVYIATKEVTYDGTISASGNLSHLEIDGPRHVLQGATAQMAATALFDDGTQYDVTGKVTWRISNTEIASISEAGLLATGSVDRARDLVVFATFGYEDVEVEATRTVVVVENASQINASEWPTFQANAQHTGYVPISLNPEDFSLRWQETMSSARMNPVSATGGRVFIADTTQLTCLDAADGETLWSVSDYCQHQPTYAYGNVYVQVGRHSSSTPRSYLKAYTADEGAEVFVSPFSQQWSTWYAPVPYDGSIYIAGGYYGGSYGFDAFSGAQQWFESLPQVDRWTPAVQGDYCFAYASGTLYGLDRYYGTRAYTISAGPSSTTSVPVLGSLNNALVINGNTLVSLDLVGQVIQWQVAGTYSGMPSVAEGVVYAVNGGRLDALDEASGQLLWQWSSPEGSLISPMIVTRSHVLASTQANAYAIDLLDRAAVWSYPASGSLSLGNDTLYIAGQSGILTAISAADYTPAVPVSLEIEGASEVLENSTMTYRALVTYDDGRVRDRTALSNWEFTATPTAAFTDGTLRIYELSLPTETVSLQAEYAQDGVTVTGTKEITIGIEGTVEELIARNLGKAIQAKENALAELRKAMALEEATLEIAQNLKHDKTDKPDSRPDVNHITSLVRLALNTERTAARGIETSMAKLLEAIAVFAEAQRGRPHRSDLTAAKSPTRTVR